MLCNLTSSALNGSLPMAPSRDTESPIKSWRVRHGLSRGDACLVLGLSDDGYGKQLSGARSISTQTFRLMEDWDTLELEQRERLLAELRIKAAKNN